MHPFRSAVESGDLDAFPALLAQDVVFLSPVAFQPYAGRPLVAAILRAAFRVFEDFRYVREVGAASAADHGLVFRATVGGREVHGIDLLRMGDDGLIEEFTVMLRPLSAANAMAEAMAIEFETIRQELGLG